MPAKDDLIARIRNLHHELSPQFLRGFSENLLSAYLCFLDTVAKLDEHSETATESIPAQVSLSAQPEFSRPELPARQDNTRN